MQKTRGGEFSRVIISVRVLPRYFVGFNRRMDRRVLLCKENCFASSILSEVDGSKRHIDKSYCVGNNIFAVKSKWHTERIDIPDVDIDIDR